MKRPPFPTRGDFVQAYLDMLRSEHGTAQHNESFWSFMIMTELVSDYPDEAFSVIKELLQIDDSPEVVGQVAAGPIEDLLVEHGLELIDAIEDEARKNPNFNHALGGVWQSDSLPEVWERVERVRKTSW